MFVPILNNLGRTKTFLKYLAKQNSLKSACSDLCGEITQTSYIFKIKAFYFIFKKALTFFNYCIKTL